MSWCFAILTGLENQSSLNNEYPTEKKSLYFQKVTFFNSPDARYYTQACVQEHHLMPIRCDAASSVLCLIEDIWGLTKIEVVHAITEQYGNDLVADITVRWVNSLELNGGCISEKFVVALFNNSK